MTAGAVLAVGETMALVTPVDAHDVETAERFLVDAAGAESNVAAHLARLGVPASWGGAVGDDALGRRVLRLLGERGVDVSSVVVDPAAPTGLLVKEPGHGVVYYRAGSAFSRLDGGYVEALPVAAASLLHLTGITPALSGGARGLVEELLRRRPRGSGLPVSFDVNFRPALWPAREAGPVLLDIARRCDVVFAGADEALALWGTGDARELARLLEVPLLVVKDGAVAATAIRADGEEARVPAPARAVLEAVGAGDAFAGGFLAAWLRGAGLVEALSGGHDRAGAVLASETDYDR